MSATVARFRPSARLVTTIGEDIIKDMHAAVVELVKNAYDADANNVTIKFRHPNNDNEQGISIEIIDDGHGMDLDTILNKWLVPSTDDKLHRIRSPKGRIMQGRKGIGRFAAAVLGEELLLYTCANCIKSSLMIDWREFTKNKFFG